MVNKESKELAKTKLKNLWTDELNNLPKNSKHFETRLIPLNKVHPNVPSKKDCRPIAVSSALVKLLESRLRRKLEDYMTHRLHRGQTGFVPNMGISVNQMRAISRIKEITNKNKHCYGLFIDYSSAYNTILHSKLYEKLNNILEQEEIQLLKALYSRNKIRLGTQHFTPNIGVAQGSVISPFLFNVYCEDMYKKIESEADINYKDLLGYADDLLVICTSPHQLKKL